MEIETFRLIVTSTVQLFLGTGAWFFGWRIARAQIDNQRSDLRIKLLDQRYAVYIAFKEFIGNCAVNDRYTDAAWTKFFEGTVRHEFLFGDEIRRYHREVTANAIAIRGLMENLPCEDGPVIGGIAGYFKGSTVLTEEKDLRKWFHDQHTGKVFEAFAPYLNFGSAGVDTGTIKLSPPRLPDPPLIRRRVKASGK